MLQADIDMGLIQQITGLDESEIGLLNTDK